MRGPLAYTAALAVVIGTVIALVVTGIVFPSAHDRDSRAASGPQLKMAGDSFDLGEVPADTTVERTVAFDNGGDAPLTVSIVKVRPAPDAACGCGVEDFEVRPGTVPPNSSGELVFMLRVPSGMPDMEDRMVAELASNDPANQQRTITIVFTMSPGGG